jgi:hypothetical protein
VRYIRGADLGCGQGILSNVRSIKQELRSPQRRAGGRVGPVFVLGIGAQKAGTTWLSQQLIRQKNYKSLFSKELHFWDHRYGIRTEREFDATQLEQILCNSDQSAFPVRAYTPIQLYFLRISMWAWRETFGLNTITADITPAYAGLPGFVFSQIGSGLDKRRIDYRVVFLMRDPLSRVLSAWKMVERKSDRSGRSRTPALAPYEVNASLLRFAGSWGCQIRTRYELTLRNIEAAFDPRRVFVGFQESIGEEHQLVRLANFLGLERRDFDSSDRVNVGTKIPPFTVETKRQIVEMYRPAYHQLGERYPQLFNLWEGFRFLA